MQEPSVSLSDLPGLWNRSLIVWPDGRRDITTFVAWLQGPNLFADLRQPDGAPSFDGVSCLDDLRRHHLRWLTQQEGFAGRLIKNGSAFEWHRLIDYQCPSAAMDAGFLHFAQGELIEEGRDVPYTEHWHHALPAGVPHLALKAIDQHGRLGFLVCTGATFMYVRDRAAPLPKGAMLNDLVEAVPLNEARALIDCEISLGIVLGSAWLIERSSLPFRAGVDLALLFFDEGRKFTTRDIAADGRSHARHWTVVELDGDAASTRPPVASAGRIAVASGAPGRNGR